MASSRFNWLRQALNGLLHGSSGSYKVISAQIPRDDQDNLLQPSDLGEPQTVEAVPGPEPHKRFHPVQRISGQAVRPESGSSSLRNGLTRCEGRRLVIVG